MIILSILAYGKEENEQLFHEMLSYRDYNSSFSRPKQLNMANMVYHSANSYALPDRNNELWIDHKSSKKSIISSRISPWMKNLALDFIRYGFVVIKQGISPILCQKAIDSFYIWCSNQRHKSCDALKNSHGHLPRVINSHVEIKEIRDVMLKNRKSMRFQDFLFGQKTSLYTSLFFTRGSEQRIHVDIPYFWTVPKNRYFGVWTALEDIDAMNGPLRVLVGGHRCHVLDDRYDLPNIVQLRKKMGRIPPVDDFVFYSFANATIDRCLSNNVTEFRDIYLKTGDTIIWHPLLPHGGAPILDPKRTRHSLVFHTG